MRNKIILFFLIIATGVKTYAKPKIVTSVSPVASIIAMLTKDEADISVINTSAGCPHEYQMRPSDKQKITGANLMFYIDDEFDSYAKSFAPILGQRMVKISNFSSIDFKDSHGLNNWHFWLDLNNVIAMQKEVASIIKRDIPLLADSVEKNLQEALDKIKLLQKKKRNILHAGEQNITEQQAHKNVKRLGELVVLSDSLEHFVKDIHGSIIRFYHQHSLSLRDFSELEDLLSAGNAQCILIDNLQHVDQYKKFGKKIIQLDSENWPFPKNNLSQNNKNNSNLFYDKYFDMIERVGSCK